MTDIIKQADGTESREWPATNSGVPELSLGTSLDDVNDSITVYPKCSYVNLSASALVGTGAGSVYGFFVNSYTPTATVKFWDNTSAATTVLTNTMVIDRVGFYPMPGFTFGTGLYCTIATAAADITIGYKMNA